MKPNKDADHCQSRQARHEHALCSHAEVMSAPSKDRHLTFPRAWAASSRTDSVWQPALRNTDTSSQTPLLPSGPPERSEDPRPCRSLFVPSCLCSPRSPGGLGQGQGGPRCSTHCLKATAPDRLHTLRDQAPMLVTSAKLSCGPDRAELKNFP